MHKPASREVTLKNEETPVQTSSNQPFERAFVPLEDFAGKIVRFNFLARKFNGQRADIAIDDIRIYEPNPIDAEIVTYYTPENGYCSYSSNDSVVVKANWRDREHDPAGEAAGRDLDGFDLGIGYMF